MLRAATLLCVSLCLLPSSEAQCGAAAHDDGRVELVVVEGRRGLRRPVERLLASHLEELDRCFVLGARSEASRSAERRADATLTVHPDGHLDAAVTLGEDPGRPAFESREEQAERARLDEQTVACLVRRLTSETLTRPRPDHPVELRLALHRRITHTPARPCSDRFDLP